jgi:hypothetical protein
MRHTVMRAACVAASVLFLAGCGDERAAAARGPSGSTALPNASPLPGSVATTGAANGTPTITLTAQHSVLVGRELIVHPVAADPDGQALTFSVSNKPAWMTFSATTGQLRGTPSPADVATYQNIRVTASDGQLQTSATTSISVLASAAGRATLSWAAPSQRTDGSPLTNLAGFRIYYGTSAADLRFVIEVKDPGARSWVIEDLTMGTWYFAATAFDSAKAESARSAVASKSIA